MSSRKGIPKRDGSGRGIRANRGRGGCEEPEDRGVRTYGRGFQGYFRRWRRALNLD